MPSPPRYVSYSLFTKKTGGAHRAWDPFERERDRYWFNVPFVPIVNDLYYPGYITRVHVEPGIRQHRFYPMLKRLSESGVLEIVECDYPFENTEPTFWRMQPIWSDDYDVVICRDIDSLPNTREAQATLAFVASPFLIQSMRTHFEHNAPGTQLLAGLCAFRSGIKPYLSGTFDDYYRMAHGNWGTDQDALFGYFIARLGSEFVKRNFLDTCVHSFPGQMQEFLPGHDAGKLAQQVYDEVNVSYVPEAVRRCLDALTTWPGQPVNARGDAGRLLIEQGTETARAVRDCMLSDSAVKAFYLP